MLDQLKQALRIGDISNLKNLLKECEAQWPESQAFSQKLSHWAAGFELDKMDQFLTQFSDD
jgi:hypothetical protein